MDGSLDSCFRSRAESNPWLIVHLVGYQPISLIQVVQLGGVDHKKEDMKVSVGNTWFKSCFYPPPPKQPLGQSRPLWPLGGEFFKRSCPGVRRWGKLKYLLGQRLIWGDTMASSLCQHILTIGSCLACVYRVMDARGKVGEHERSVRVARGPALQTSQVHP